MKEIKLTNSPLIVLVDDEDYDNVLAHAKTWCMSRGGHPQARSVLWKMNVMMHEVILVNPSIEVEVDHKNRNKLDNRRENLRLATRSQNLVNREKKPIYTSKYKGVNFAPKKGLKYSDVWVARVSLKGKRYFGGYHKEEIDAAKAANVLYIKLYGEFAVLNEV